MSDPLLSPACVMTTLRTALAQEVRTRPAPSARRAAPPNPPSPASSTGLTSPHAPAHNPPHPFPFPPALSPRPPPPNLPAPAQQRFTAARGLNQPGNVNIPGWRAQVIGWLREVSRGHVIRATRPRRPRTGAGHGPDRAPGPTAPERVARRPASPLRWSRATSASPSRR